MGDSRPQNEKLTNKPDHNMANNRSGPKLKQTNKQKPRQRFGEYNFVPELKIWDRQAGRQADTGTS